MEAFAQVFNPEENNLQDYFNGVKDKPKNPEVKNSSMFS